MKKVLFAIAVVLVIAACAAAWIALGSATAFSEKSRYLYIATGKADKASILDSIKKNGLLSNPSMFDRIASQMNVWGRVKPGRYKIEKGQSIISISKMLRNNNQSAVNLVINKLRTQQDLAKIIGRNFELDSSDVIDYITD